MKIVAEYVPPGVSKQGSGSVPVRVSEEPDIRIIPNHSQVLPQKIVVLPCRGPEIAKDSDGLCHAGTRSRGEHVHQGAQK